MSVSRFLRLFAFLNIEIKNFLLSFFFFLVENDGKRRRVVAAGEGAEMAHSRGDRDIKLQTLSFPPQQHRLERL
jgi:hypothetical protein